MARVEANGLNFNVNRYRVGPPGDRPVVVCIHGFAIASGASSSYLVGFDLARHADVITYDLRGHGRSELPPVGYTLTDHAVDLAALLDALGITEPVHVIGFSYGGAIATVATLRYPERVASLSLLDGIVPLPGWQKSFYASIEHYEGVIEGAKARGMELDEIVGEMIAWVMENVGVSRRHATIVARRICRMFEQTSLQADLRNEVAVDEEEIGRIRCPTLAVYGDRSDLYHLIDDLPRLLPDVRTHTLPGADHQDVYWRIDEVRPLVRDFLGLPSTG